MILLIVRQVIEGESQPGVAVYTGHAGEESQEHEVGVSFFREFELGV